MCRIWCLRLTSAQSRIHPLSLLSPNFSFLPFSLFHVSRTPPYGYRNPNSFPPPSAKEGCASRNTLATLSLQLHYVKTKSK